MTVIITVFVFFGLAVLSVVILAGIVALIVALLEDTPPTNAQRAPQQTVGERWTEVGNLPTRTSRSATPVLDTSDPMYRTVREVRQQVQSHMKSESINVIQDVDDILNSRR